MIRSPGRWAAAAAAAAALASAPAADAHVQVSPTAAATDDGVLFTALVPNERDRATTAVEIKIPTGMLAYGFEDPPGWRHRTILASDQSIDRVRWTGTLPAGDFVRFSWLASTPEQPTTVAWKALQSYSDGTIVRWIGAPGTESPASETVIKSGIPKQGAGGEIGQSPTAPVPPPVASAAGPAPDAAPDWVARGLATAALVAALTALALTALRRRSGPPADPTTLSSGASS